MEIREIRENKKQFLSLLLLADEQEDMIDRYLEKGTMYVLDDHGIKAECVVTDEGNGCLEIKNIATSPESQRKGYGRARSSIISFRNTPAFIQSCRSEQETARLPSPSTKMRFCPFHLIQNSFIDHYNHPIYECGVQLVDMVYLQRPL